MIRGIDRPTRFDGDGNLFCFVCVLFLTVGHNECKVYLHLYQTAAIASGLNLKLRKTINLWRVTVQSEFDLIRHKSQKSEQVSNAPIHSD